MDFMGIGPLEILLILILGFLFLGPKKLPEMAAKAGRMYRNFRKATFDLSKSITEEIPPEIKNAKTSLKSQSDESDIATKAGQVYSKLKKATSDLSKSITEDLSGDTAKTETEKPPAPASDEKPNE